jgi:hypothetical protein
MSVLDGFSFTLALNSITTALGSPELVLNHIKFSFFIALGIFFIILPFCSSRKSLFDVIAARKVIKTLRFFVFLELICLCILFNFYFSYGNPIYLHAGLQFGDGDSWLYGYARPIFGFTFIIMGMFGDMHPAPRICCLVACLIQIFSDSISACQIRDQYHQVKVYGSGSNGYSLHNLLVYYWRDIISIALATICLLFSGLLNCIVGWCAPQLIHPALISGRDYDRRAVFHIARDKRKEMERQETYKDAAQYFTKSTKERNNAAHSYKSISRMKSDLEANNDEDIPVEEGVDGDPRTEGLMLREESQRKVSDKKNDDAVVDVF